MRARARHIHFAFTCLALPLTTLWEGLHRNTGTQSNKSCTHGTLLQDARGPPDHRCRRPCFHLILTCSRPRRLAVRRQGRRGARRCFASLQRLLSAFTSLGRSGGVVGGQLGLRRVLGRRGVVVGGAVGRRALTDSRFFVLSDGILSGFCVSVLGRSDDQTNLDLADELSLEARKAATSRHAVWT